MNEVTLYLGDCLDVMAGMEPNSIDTIITDPPYGLGKEPDAIEMLKAWLADAAYRSNGGGFMGKKWDAFVPGPRYWREMLRVAKPGATALVCGGTRTYYLTTLAMRIAGWSIRDTLFWVYAQGFPKAADISKQLDKMAGAEREAIAPNRYAGRRTEGSGPDNGDACYGQYGIPGAITAPATPSAQLWDGWKSHGLKPAYEPIILAMKPNEGSYAANALAFGVSGLNIDGGRIETNGESIEMGRGGRDTQDLECWRFRGQDSSIFQSQGRYPANLLLECNCGAGQGGKHAEDCVCGMLDRQSGESMSSGGVTPRRMNFLQGVKAHGDDMRMAGNRGGVGDTGGASRFFRNIPAERFFYCPKASRRERNAGLEGMEKRYNDFQRASSGLSRANGDKDGRKGTRSQPQQNHHPTVKPIKLMEYLCELTRTPTGGIVLDPFMGSGSTGVACVNTGRPFIGAEIARDSFEIAQRRIEYARNQARQLEMVV